MMQITDCLAVGATKPTLVYGVPAKLFLMDISLSILPGIYLNALFFNGESVAALFITWGVIFFSVYRLVLYFTRKDVNFLSVIGKSLVLTQRIRNYRFWGGVNTYSVD